MDDELIDIERVVVVFADFELPCADTWSVVDEVFELVEVDEGAFEFIEMQVMNVGHARDLAQ